MAHTPGQIYLADQRGLVATAQQQRFSTLSFGPYAAEGRGAFGRLLALNEELVAPGQAISLAVAQAAWLLLLPVQGAVAYQGPAGLAGTTDVEQALVLALPTGVAVQLRNTYDSEVITFLHIWLSAEGVTTARAGAEEFAYRFADLDGQLAPLVPASGQRPFALRLGRFQGRQEAVYQAASTNSRLFAFVLAGAFELEGRLLHAHDGLALWPCPAAELEALSNDALLLLLEL